MTRMRIAMTLPVLLLGACTWVKMEPGGTRVRVLALDAPVDGCTRLGEVGVSVKDRVAFYQRNDLKVRDELETLARNEAVGLGADAIRPLEEPAAGEQRFTAYRCGTAAPGRSRAPAGGTDATTPPASQPLQLEEAETYPVRDD
jgi:hypothetical protein